MASVVATQIEVPLNVRGTVERGTAGKLVWVLNRLLCDGDVNGALTSPVMVIKDPN